MPSQDSDGESYVSHLIADPKTYGDQSPCGRTADEEEDAHLMRINDSRSEEEDPSTSIWGYAREVQEI